MLMPAQPRMDADVVEKLDALGKMIEAHAEPDHADPYDDAILAATFGLIELMKKHDAELRSLQRAVKKMGRSL